ncbi:MAG: divergent polysaccharide deacetylase family protein [Alphaproteobacteria bacterium]
MALWPFKRGKKADPEDSEENGKKPAEADSENSDTEDWELSPRRLMLIGGITVGAAIIGIGLGVGLIFVLGPQTGDAPTEVSVATDTPPPRPSPRQGMPRVVFEHPEQLEREPIPHITPPAKSAANEGEDQQAALPRLLPPPEAREAKRLPPWQRYAVAVTPSPDRPMISIVIDDLGMNRKGTARAIAFKGPLTLAFLPYAGDLKRQIAAARAAGHELLVHVSMEPVSQNENPGPNVLTASLGNDELLRRLRWALDRFDGYVGINNHMGSRFTSFEAGMKVVMGEIKARGLLFLDSRTSIGSRGVSMARRLGVPHARRHIFLDDTLDAETVRARLAEVEAAASQAGYVVAIGHPHKVTLDALAQWLPGVARRGFQLVPISAIVRKIKGKG